MNGNPYLNSGLLGQNLNNGLLGQMLGQGVSAQPDWSGQIAALQLQFAQQRASFEAALGDITKRLNEALAEIEKLRKPAPAKEPKAHNSPAGSRWRSSAYSYR